MRIGLNILYLIPHVFGGSRIYATSLIDALAALDQNNEYFVFVNQQSLNLELPLAPNFHRIPCEVNAMHRPMRHYWEQIVLPTKVRQLNIDVLHSLGYVAPLNPPCSSVVSILDVNFVALKRVMPTMRRIFLHLLVYTSGHQADHVLTISYFSKEQIRAHLQLAPDKITVTHLGSRSQQTQLSEMDSLRTLQQYGIRHPYVIAFSSFSIHKNIPLLVKAFASISQELPHQLVLLGNLPPQVAKPTSTIELLNPRIVSTGFVPDVHVLPLLSHAELFVFPSWHEGFGLPVLEAQQVGVAVACSSAGSLPEVAGDGAFFFNPYSVGEMASAIQRCLSNTPMRLKLIESGRKNLERFSWAQTAQRTLEVYERVYKARRSK